MVMEVIGVWYQDQEVGALSFDTEQGFGAFEYTPEFIRSGIELAPLTMPLTTPRQQRIYSFPELQGTTFHGLPGLVADALPDDFGNAVLNAWVSSRGLQPADITPLQRLQYIGKRGMGALEFRPATRVRGFEALQQVSINELTAIAQDVLDHRAQFQQNLPSNAREDGEAMLALLSVGTSAGGARPKAVLALNADFTQVYSGQTDAPDGFRHYLMKFDGVVERSSGQETFGDPQGFGAMEYVYYLLAQQCGIDMMPSHLLAEGDRRHFLTQRFDRDGNHKIHTQTLNGIAHVDYKKPGSFSYSELFAVARRLGLRAPEAEQLMRRMLFNIVARNHDDHAKNFAFQLRADRWQLAPAYDVAYSYKPGSKWVNQHWMQLNGKRENFTRDDIYTLEKVSPLFTRRKLDEMLEQTLDAVSQWPQLAHEHEVPQLLIDEIAKHQRLDL
ncbi:toxin HipA [Pseudidiomarina atlantica]|uniref:Toxin HipA n=1 Tax=Pseudidiomarina atlantica TaxID=1517416 RepID=A0A094IPQ8_9GAMM|nr:type II toxin-antitoxin system HipA family toxin [Pseudidiomarina atlantica]KFZ29112.1 toxin HipA [Pseudidiomarina atlantica]